MSLTLLPAFSVHNFPNPFSDKTSFVIGLPEDGKASLTIYTRAGERVCRVLANSDLAAGVHLVAWNGVNDHGRTIAPGTYEYVLDYAHAGKTDRIDWVGGVSYYWEDARQASDTHAYTDSIDTVLCTHLHVDHVGWNTQLENGRWVPTFPKARYLFAKREYAHWENEHKTLGAETNGGSFDDSVLPVVEERYRGREPAAATWFWRANAPFARLPAGRALVVEDTQPFALRYGFDSNHVDGWQRACERPASALGLGMWGVRLEAHELAGASVHFTRRYGSEWEQRDWQVVLG